MKRGATPAIAALIALGCGSKERDATIARLSSPSAKQRAEAVRALSKSSGDETWAALLKASRDGSPAVRAEAAQAMAAVKRDDAPDALAPLLRDPDDLVRIAAVRALSARCGERSDAVLRLAFARSGAAVREQIAQALRKCGVDPVQALRHEETGRRRKALELLASAFAAQRARAARELGLLGRDEDRKSLLPLLDDRDGVAAAAAARALGEAGAQEAAPRIRALLADGGEVSAAAAEALAALGPQALAPAQPQLLELAKGSGDEAVSAAAAVSAARSRCTAAVTAQNPGAAALLASGCPAQPFARALSRGAKNDDALIESLLHAEGPAPGLDAALSKRLRDGSSDARVPRLALRYRAAGPALLISLRREQALRSRELHERQRSAADSDGSAAEIAKVQAPGAPDKERYARLMARLRERAGAEATRASASTRLDALLQGEPRSGRRAFTAAALRAVLALNVPGAGRVAGSFAADPDPAIAAAARGEPDAARSGPPEAALDPRIALWSDDGAVRARACAGTDPSLAATRSLLAQADPERRVRDACSATNETAPGKQR